MADTKDKPKTDAAPSADVKDKKDGKTHLGRGAWGQKIVAPKPALFKHKSPLFPAGHISAYICGASGTGKTTVMLEMLPNIEGVVQICVFTLVLDNPINQVIRDYCEDHGIEFMLTADPETGSQELQEFMKKKERAQFGVCIFDDFVKQNEPPQNPYKMCMTSVAQFLRNYNYHNIMISQSPAAIPAGARNNVNLRIVFKLENSVAMRPVKDEFVNTGMGNDVYFRKVYDAMLHGGRFSYFALVSDQDEPRIYIHLQKEGEDHMGRAPLQAELRTLGRDRAPTTERERDSASSESEESDH